MREASEQNKYTIKLYTPHDGQLLLHNNTARFRVMCCGRRFGKTLAATNELARKALEKRASLNWWIAPTYSQTSIAFELLSEALAPVLSKRPNHGKLRLDLINGSVIECKSAEAYENLRGHGPNFVVFDEASKCPREAWEQVVSPALASSQGGAIFISTPWGRDWFYDLFMLGQDDTQDEWWSHSFPTAANPFIPEKEIDFQRRTLPEFVFAQEFMAVFLDDAASTFRKVDSCIAGTWMEPEYGHSYVIGWDIAKYDDYSVLSVMDTQTHHLVNFDRFNRITYQDQIDNHVVPLAKKYNNAKILMDGTGVGDAVYEELKKRDVDCSAYKMDSNTKKRLIVDKTVVAIEHGYITYPNHPILIEELKTYGFKLTPSGVYVYSAPDGKHDDCVISLCLAVWGAKISGPIPMAISRRIERPAVTTTMAEIIDADNASKAVPVVQQVDDAFIMQRQIQMAKLLKQLGSSAPYQATDIPKDSMWGAA